MAERMLAALPRASLVEIPGAFHHLVLDAPDAFVRALDDFLTRTL
jgi:pimeloyl-ACP methyl ester carboxylesterase